MNEPTRRALTRFLGGWFSLAATVVSVWLGWEIVRAPLAARTPPELAVRIAPSSPQVLSVAAEAEFKAGRSANARALAAQSLAKAPFNARALRTWGLTEAQTRPTVAVEALTLAGNWSLRDDPSHAWLFEYHLRQGNFGSAFAHLDTLTRRRDDLRPQLFDLLNKAATSDPRGLEALLRLLSMSPPWRQLFFEYLQDTAKSDGLSATLAISLDNRRGELTPAELGRLYSVLADRQQYALLREVRTRVGAPGVTALVQDPDFDTPLEDQIHPFGWSHEPVRGSSIQISEEDIREKNSALRVQYDGFGGRSISRQLLLLSPGDYALKGEFLVATATNDTRLIWAIDCVSDGKSLVRHALPIPNDFNQWRRFRTGFSVPPGGCPAQWLTLKPNPGERRSLSIVWFDKVDVEVAADGASRSPPAASPR